MLYDGCRYFNEYYQDACSPCKKTYNLGVQGSLRLHGFRGGCVRQDGFLSLVSMNVVFLLCATVGVEVRWGFLAGHGTGRELPFILIFPHSLGQMGQLPSLSF